MNKIIKVGNSSNPENHIKINDRSISRNHLEVRMIDANTLKIKDLGSQNGTWIGGLQIVESTLTKDQVIKIGHQKYSGEEFFAKINSFFLDDKVLWVKEFKALESKFNEYEKKKSKIYQAYQTKINVIRMLFMMAIIGFFLFYGEGFGLDPSLRVIFSLFGGSLFAFLVPLLFSKDKENVTDKTIALRKKYSSILACPRCKRDLSSQPYSYWQHQRKCTCDAIWVE